jgi:oligopeptide/dipeptide ABC transporter ATP-binding protein
VSESPRSLIEVEDLYVAYPSRKRLFRPTPPPVQAVNGVSFSIERRRTFGLVGESGSGKSTLARAMLQLVPITSGAIRLDGDDVTEVAPRSLGQYRRRVQAVLQDPYSSLNQAHDVSVIVGDPITVHRSVRRGRARDALVVELLDQVGLSPDFLHRYPAQMSGGQRQRVSLARALAVQPDLIIADEATSALDVSIQSQVINLLRRVQREEQVALLVISHDLEVVRHISDEVGVMYLGTLVERGNAEDLYSDPTHPYTAMLIASIPVPDPVEQAGRRALRRRVTIDAEPPSPAALPPGCPFANRCPLAMEICLVETPPAVVAWHGGTVRCHAHTSGPTLGGAGVSDRLSIGDGVDMVSNGSSQSASTDRARRPT